MRHGKIQAALLLVIVVVACWVRLIQLTEKNLWYDETLTLREAAGQTVQLPYNPSSVTIEDFFLPLVPDIDCNNGQFTPADFWNRNRLGNVVRATIQLDRGNGLVNNLVLHGWLGLFGTGDFAIRFPSLIFGILTILFAFLFYAKAFPSAPPAGRTLASLFVSVHVMMICASAEVRPYSPAVFFSFLSTLMLIILWRGMSGRREACAFTLGYAFATVCALLAHYLTIYIFVAHVVFALIYVRDRKIWLPMVGGWLFTAAIIASWFSVGVLPYLNVMRVHDQLYLYRAQHNVYCTTATWDHLRDALMASWANLFNMHATNWLSSSNNLVLILWFGVYTLLSLHLYYMLALTDRPMLSFLFLLIISAPACALALSIRSGHTLPFLNRYLTFSCPYVCVFLAACSSQIMGITMSRIRGRPIYCIVAPVVVAGGIFVFIQSAVLEGWRAAPCFSRLLHPYRSCTDEYFLASKVLRVNYELGDVVVYPSRYSAVLINMYLDKSQIIIQQIDPSARDAGLSRIAPMTNALNTTDPAPQLPIILKKTRDNSSHVVTHVTY